MERTFFKDLDDSLTTIRDLVQWLVCDLSMHSLFALDWKTQWPHLASLYGHWLARQWPTLPFSFFFDALLLIQKGPREVLKDQELWPYQNQTFKWFIENVLPFLNAHWFKYRPRQSHLREIYELHTLYLLIPHQNLELLFPSIPIRLWSLIQNFDANAFEKNFKPCKTNDVQFTQKFFYQKILKKWLAKTQRPFPWRKEELWALQKIIELPKTEKIEILIALYQWEKKWPHFELLLKSQNKDFIYFEPFEGKDQHFAHNALCDLTHHGELQALLPSEWLYDEENSEISLWSWRLINQKSWFWKYQKPPLSSHPRTLNIFVELSSHLWIIHPKLKVPLYILVITFIHTWLKNIQKLWGPKTLKCHLWLWGYLPHKVQYFFKILESTQKQTLKLNFHLHKALKTHHCPKNFSSKPLNSVHCFAMLLSEVQNPNVQTAIQHWRPKEVFKDRSLHIHWMHADIVYQLLNLGKTWISSMF